MKKSMINPLPSSPKLDLRTFIPELAFSKKNVVVVVKSSLSFHITKS